MEKLVRGIHHFQTTHFNSNRELYERLSEGQSPDTLLITCSDSRITPDLLMQTNPGDLFVLRNAGNIIPPYGVPGSGEGATIEFAIRGLDIRHIIVMGHSNCGAIKGLLSPEQLQNMPLMIDWLNHTASTLEIVKECYSDLNGEDLLNAAIKENVLVQLDNLRTYPVVAARLAKESLMLHGWIYEISSGKIFAFDPSSSSFSPLTSHTAKSGITSRQSTSVRSVSSNNDLGERG